MWMGSYAAASFVKNLTCLVYQPSQALPFTMSSSSAHLVPEGGLPSSKSPHPSQKMPGQDLCSPPPLLPIVAPL